MSSKKSGSVGRTGSSAGNRRHHEWSAVIVTTFPKAVRVIEHTLIPLKDGTTLAARIWLPDDAEQNPFLRSWNISLIASATAPTSAMR